MIISMKSLIMVTVLVVLLAFVIAIAAPLIDRAPAEDPVEKVSEAISEAAPETPSPINEEKEISGDEELISALIEGEIKEMTIHDYLIGVLAAEMPASFEIEALRSQAVAARTYALNRLLVTPSAKHTSAAVCGDKTCCMAFADEADMLEKWGSSYAAYRDKIEMAVSSTAGLCLVFKGEPVLAVFHSSSAGKTEASENVWGVPVPYLRPADSPESGDSVPNYVVSVTVSLSDFKDTIRAAFPHAVLSDKKPLAAENAVYTESGRLSSVVFGGVTVTGTKLRELFGLRSAAVAIDLTEDAVILTTTGYGHGVGMSQYGANTLAKNGLDFSEILLHYYEGAELVSAAELVS